MPNQGVQNVRRSEGWSATTLEREIVDLRELYRSAPVGMCIVDTELRYLIINERLAEINALSVEDHVGRSIPEVVPGVAPEVLAVLHRTIATGQPILNLEVSGEVPSAPGETRHYLVSHHPIKDDEGVVRAVSSAVQDITAQKRAEQALEEARAELERRVLERTAELQRANRHLVEQAEQREKLEEQLLIRQRLDSVGTLAGGIAHDFNNLLHTILANLCALEFDELEPTGREHLESARTACRRAATLTARLAGLARGSTEPRVPTDVYEIASEVFALLESTTDRRIDKRVNFTAGRFVVSAAPGELHQALLNLATNAVQALTEAPGDSFADARIEIDAERLEVTLPGGPLQLGLHVHLMLRDSGPGMSEEVRRRALDPLFTTRQRDGNRGQGLGLAMVWNIISQRHGGHVLIESEPGSGTCVHLYLPAVDEQAVSQREEPIQAPGGGAEHVLIVEDEPPLLQVTRTALTEAGYRVSTASDGVEALAIYRRERPDLLLVDLMMPRMSGEQLCEQVLREDPSARFVVSTGYGELSSDGRALAHAAGTLRKPYSLGQLLAAVREACDRPAPREPGPARRET